MNLYTTIGVLKADLALTSSTYDSDLLRIAEAASREVDDATGRHFFVETKTRRMDSSRSDLLQFDDDLLALTSLKSDTEQDGTFDGETLVEGTDFTLWPYNDFPKLEAHTLPWGNNVFPVRAYSLEAVGRWGYGDGRSATPYADSGFTGTLDDGTDTSLAVNSDASGVISPGHTLQIEDEQVYVEALDSNGTTATVERNVNGTTAAAHAAAALQIYRYPAAVERFTAWLASEMFKIRDKAGFQQEKIGDYFYTRLARETAKEKVNVLSSYVRGLSLCH